MLPFQKHTLKRRLYDSNFCPMEGARMSACITFSHLFHRHAIFYRPYSVQGEAPAMTTGDLNIAQKINVVAAGTPPQSSAPMGVSAPSQLDLEGLRGAGLMPCRVGETCVVADKVCLAFPS